VRAIAALAAAAALAIAASCAHDADAAPVRALHFTSTYTSYPDPSGANGTIALVLPPSEGTIYVGSLTYASGSPIQAVVLHELHGPPAGQPTWRVPGQDALAASRLGEPAASASLGFAGAAVLLHSAAPEPFVATASVDAFARGQPAEIRAETIEVAERAPEVRLVRAEVPVELPLHEGILDGGRVLYAVTESSDAGLAERISESQGRPVTHAPPLAALLEEAESGGHEPPRVYVFRNGVKGAGLEGYQHEVFEAGPGDRGYSPASELVYAEWRRNLTPEVLASAEEVGQAVADRRVALEEPGIVLNLPAVSWPGGEVPLRPAVADAQDGAPTETGGADEAGDAPGGGADPEDGDAGEGGGDAEETGEGAGGAMEGGDGNPGEKADGGDEDTPEGNGGASDVGAEGGGDGGSGEEGANGAENGGDDGNGGGADTREESGDGGAESPNAGDPAGGKEGAGSPDAQGEATDVDVPEAHQVSEVNVEEMTATFIARRAWGPDGQTVYHIMAGAAPPGPARVTGTADARGMQNYTATDAVADLHYFRGGLAGDGALGSQPSVAAAVPGDEGYSPLWRVHVVEWADAGAAAVIETLGDIGHLADAGEVTVSAARPLNLDLVVNAPIVDPFWDAEEEG